MRQYITRRLLQMIPVLIGVSFLIFMIFTFAPGDAVSSLVAAHPNMSAVKIAQLRHLYHLDEPKLVQYGNWLVGFLHGDLGQSVKLNQPVSHILNTYIWNSFYLQLVAFIISTIIAIPIGVISATKQYSFFDSAFTVFALIGISLPSFFMGLLLMKWFAVDMRIFPVSGMTSAGMNYKGFKLLVDIAQHMFLPCLVITLINVSSLMRYVRMSMLEVIKQDYIRTARSKGLKEKVVIYKHALRNGMIPVVTILGMSIGTLFSGAVITEQIFAWPGIGKLTVTSINDRDYPVLMGINMIMVVFTLLGNLLADVCYALVDPRIKLK
ncbi:ABC transporter permease [Clostridium guangxiense]|uniref:ABC transporter permease n=1 Tax=Clostridium guangxiense TaxID=1662055 RepID=UPI001E33C60D|nr:ABC transporter permease [Clostridium guangxiense]MCD2345410.1 ABC transporter permease [Clostridium guangxiense]